MTDPTPYQPGPLESQTIFYPEGAEIVLPNGRRYRRVGDHWELLPE